MQFNLLQINMDSAKNTMKKDASTQPIIFVVDDEPANLNLISRLLSPYYRVRVADSGDRMLELVVNEPRPDLILLDVMMPNMDGYSTLARLKNNTDTKSIPVIFITTMDTEDDEEKGLSNGAVDYINKPIKPAILLARIKTHLLLKQASDYLKDKNVYLETEVTRRMHENQVIQSVSIRALAHLAEARDTETGDHILRTQMYVEVLARKLQENPRFSGKITEEYIELLSKSAPLHDIGKVGIPDNILLKPGKLTPDEWEIMKTHAEIGALAIERSEKDVEQPVQFLSLAKEISHRHHEHWDGNGYPDGLSGDDIPISARIMAIADVFDALISSRVYKQAMSMDETREIMLAKRNNHFDPDMIDAFFAEFHKYVAIAESINNQ